VFQVEHIQSHWEHATRLPHQQQLASLRARLSGHGCWLQLQGGQPPLSGGMMATSSWSFNC
jgi:hypothetical protein